MLTAAQVAKIRKGVATHADRLAQAFCALGDPNRLKIFCLLLRERDVCVTDVARVLRVSVAAASQQLRVLDLTGLIRKERMGQMICYTIRDEDPLVQSLIRMVRRYES